MDELHILEDLRFLLDVVIAASLSAALGWEREIIGKPAGLRTHILVGVASCLFMILAVTLVDRFADVTMPDPVRAITAVATGISFLGAGTIFVSRGRRGVHGLTTAASILATAAVGIAVALQRYALAVGVTVVLLVTLRAVAAAAAKARPPKSGPDDEPGDL